MLRKATLAGVPGVVDLRFQLLSGIDGEWRGTFFFGSDDERSVARMVGNRPVTLETTLEEERRVLSVMITSLMDSGRALLYTDARSVPTDGPGIALPN